MTDTQKQPASVPLDLVTQWLNDWGNSGCLSVLQFVANRAAAYGREQAQWVPAVHAAELAAIEHERSGVEGAMYARILALEAELAEAEAKGRMEALAYNPPIPAEIKGRVQAEWFWKGVLAMREQEETK